MTTELLMFTYDPITSLVGPETAVENDTTILDLSTSGSLNALSVQRSALSHLSATEQTSKTPGSIGMNLGSQTVFFPLPTRITDAESSAEQLKNRTISYCHLQAYYRPAYIALLSSTHHTPPIYHYPNPPSAVSCLPPGRRHRHPQPPLNTK
jgi:hypothetical protein